MKVGKPVEIHANFRFTVAIDNINEAAFTECTLPSFQVETQDITEGGQNEFVHKLPVRVKPGTITLRHGVTRSGVLLGWYLMVLDGKVARAKRAINIVLHDSKLKPILSFRFQGAYPIKWSGPTLKAGEQALAIEELELVYHGFEIG